MQGWNNKCRYPLLSLLNSNVPRLSKVELQFIYFRFSAIYTFNLNIIFESRWCPSPFPLKKEGLDFLERRESQTRAEGLILEVFLY